MRTKTQIVNNVMAAFKPSPKMTVSEWADKYRRLSSESSASPGKWRTSTFEALREPMDCVTDHSVNTLVIMAGSQVGKTEIILNTIGKFIDHEPSPILILQPTVEMAEAFSKDRVAPMVRDTPALRGKIIDNKARNNGNTILHKVFPGGHLTIVGANAPAGLASRPIRMVLGDEVDRYPLSAGKEGDPVTLAFKRTVTYWNRIKVLTSTPVDRKTSRILKAYEEGDQRRYNAVCPSCGEPQVLKWAQVKWTDNNPWTAYYECEHNGCIWNDQMRNVAVANGFWRAEKPFTGVASFHMPGLMSPFIRLAEGVEEFLNAKDHQTRLKTWTNTFLGEAWDDTGARIESHFLAERAAQEGWSNIGELPEGITLLTAGVDVQINRIEIEVVGWGDDQESWSVDYKVIKGDPTTPEPWKELANYVNQVYEHPLFGKMCVETTCIDSGYATLSVYRYSQFVRRGFVVKGITGHTSKAIVGKPNKNNQAGVEVYPVGTHSAKELVHSRLVAQYGEVGYCHFPTQYDIEYYKQMTAESLVTRFHRGFEVKEWTKNRKRNEVFDCRVYATAALELLALNLNRHRLAKIEQQKRMVEFSKNPKAAVDKYSERWQKW